MFCYYLIALLSVLLYLHGFFPIPSRSNVPPIIYHNETLKPKFQKAVIIVIDALRVDFVTFEKMPFLYKTYTNTGCFIHLKVETPTVTLPRIKALTSGNVPQFVDIVLNLANPTVLEDSFIHRAHARKKYIVFYGDDIWLKLFPKHFKRSEGTSSFFVNDFTEVDDNVTRNIDNELRRTDWDIMILHYLGLDHIGHVYGPKSSLITTKLKEMDNIIEKIFNNSEKTLFFITGDHGMRDSGGHGGSTFPETNVPLIVLGMPCANSSFAQIDIPANLAILLGFEIPMTSIGQLQFNLLKHLSMTELLEALKYNTFLLRNKLDLCDENFETAKHFHDLYLLSHNVELGQSAVDLYTECSKKISEKLLKTSVKQNIKSLVIASVMILSIIAKILQNFCNLRLQFHNFEKIVMFVIVIFQFLNTNEIHSFIVVAVAIILFLRNIVCFKYKYLVTVTRNMPFLLFLSVVHPLSFLSSSFLEEEHQFWYFFGGTFIVLKCLESKAKEWFLVFISLRFLRTINQVGDKWASEPDLADWLLKKENYLFLQILFITGLILTYFSNSVLEKYNKIHVIIDGFVLILIYIFKTVLNENVLLGQIIWILILSKFILCVITKNNLSIVWVLIISLLIKPHNVIIIPSCIFASQYFHKVLKSETLVMAHWWLGNLLFFAQGHDNSLASVDISSGYIGLRNYQPLLVFPQVLCHTYAFPVLSHLLLFRNKSFNRDKYFSLFMLLRLYIIVVVFIVTFIHRHHLFIWSVFAPKIFVEASHFGFLFLEICCFYLYCIINKCFV